MEEQESEAHTRRQRIDPLLQAHGWTVEPFQLEQPPNHYEAHALTEFATANGPADYALVVGGKVLGIVEAKKVTFGPQGILTQAERYSKGVTDNPFNFSGCRVPFLYSTNGEVIWFQDVRHELNTAREIAGFHTPSALQEMISRDLNGACSWDESGSTSRSLPHPPAAATGC